jgi:hypothetical protein
MTRTPRVLIAALLGFCFTSSCQLVWGVRHHGDRETWVLVKDPSAFLGKEVHVVFRRTGDPRMYLQRIHCILLQVEQDYITVRGLDMDKPSIKADYVDLLELGKLLPVEGQPGVFRIRRSDIDYISHELSPNHQDPPRGLSISPARV